jgi:predicted alpha/beta superfamily hydrolase
MVIVGISYEADDARALYYRSRDYFPTYVSPEELAEKFNQVLADLIPISGGAPNFLRFFQDELFSLVEHEYRVDPSDRGIFGHSAGGNFAAWVLFNTPGVFQRYLIGSPFLPWDDGLAYRQEAAYAERHSALPAKVFLSIGDKEGEGTVERLKRLKDAMESRNYEGLDLAYTVFDGETHMSGLPVTYSTALLKLYGR